MNRTALAHLVILIVGVILAIYFLVDDTPEAWMVRLAWAGAITAGLAAVLLALAYLADNLRYPDRPRQP
jgi:hypothetical protein